jgi:ferredoxin-thioredoxin reductase catalytic subunit
MTNHKWILLRLNSNLIHSTYNIIENLAYVIMGFAATYISLEVAWHFTACRFKDDSSDEKKTIMKPCVFKEMKMVLMATQASPGRVM